MSWFLVTLFLSLTFSSVSEANHDTKHPSAAFVVGTVYCDTCFQQDFHFISGASITVVCKDGSSKPRFRKEAKTNEHGKFKVQLPFSVSKHVKRIKGCTVTLINSSEPYCAVASAATSSSLHLKSRRPGEHVFSAGFFSFKPLKQPSLCNQKPSFQNSKQFDSVKSAFPQNIDPIFPPPIQDPTRPGGLLPPLPKLPGLSPLPELPPLPPLPRMPRAPSNPGRAEDSSTAESSNKPQFSDRKVGRPGTIHLPPIPFLPPPFNSIPNPNPSPFQPPPLTLNPLQPPSTLPLFPSPNPNPLQPPQSGQFPTVPGLTPFPPPAFPFPFPPFSPMPPASTSENASP